MSRIGKKPIAFPKTVKISQSDGIVKVEGPKGKLSSKLPQGITMSISDNQLVVERASDGAPCPLLSWIGQDPDQQYGDRRQHRL